MPPLVLAKSRARPRPTRRWNGPLIVAALSVCAAATDEGEDKGKGKGKCDEGDDSASDSSAPSSGFWRRMEARDVRGSRISREHQGDCVHDNEGEGHPENQWEDIHEDEAAASTRSPIVTLPSWEVTCHHRVRVGGGGGGGGGGVGQDDVGAFAASSSKGEAAANTRDAAASSNGEDAASTKACEATASTKAREAAASTKAREAAASTRARPSRPSANTKATMTENIKNTKNKASMTCKNTKDKATMTETTDEAATRPNDKAAASTKRKADDVVGSSSSSKRKANDVVNRGGSRTPALESPQGTKRYEGVHLDGRRGES